MKGRKPKPTALHKLHGILRPKEHAARENEPPAPGELGVPPPELDERQAMIWQETVAHAPLGVLRRADREILHAWCLAVDRHLTAAQQQAAMDVGNKLPLLVKDPRTGRALISPYVRIMDRAVETMARLGSELGLSPAARVRLAGTSPPAVPADPQSPWARLLQGGKNADPAT